MSNRESSADRLRAKLAKSTALPRLYQTEAQYHMQVDYTCQLLDVVDEVADRATAMGITDLIFGRLAGKGADEAWLRAEAAQGELMQLRAQAQPQFPTALWSPG